MTEEIKDLNEKNEDAQPTERVVMQLILTNEGQLKVVSPFLNDKTACYGMLELAKDAIREAHKPNIIKPNGHNIMDFVRGKR